MKLCDERWRQELVDHILGSSASRALTEHLESCAVCSEARREGKARMGRIDGAIRQLATAEPSAQAAARVMTAVRVQRERGWLPEWRWAVATLAGVILMAALVYVWRVRTQRQETARALSAASAIASWRSPTAGLLQSPANRWLKAPPRLGEYFYQLKTDIPQKESENP